jgi:hypothetical protein
MKITLIILILLSNILLAKNEENNNKKKTTINREICILMKNLKNKIEKLERDVNELKNKNQKIIKKEINITKYQKINTREEEIGEILKFYKNSKYYHFGTDK